jgi:hypothetical protein
MAHITSHLSTFRPAAFTGQLLCSRRLVKTLYGMWTKLIVILYFTFLAVLAVGLVYLGTNSGYPLWLMIGIAYIVVLVVNSSLAYCAQSLKLKRQGESPPSYFEFLFQPFREVEFTRPIRVPTLVRITLGSLVLLMAALLLAAGSAMVLLYERNVHILVGTALFAFGIISIWLGYRFLKKESPRLE